MESIQDYIITISSNEFNIYFIVLALSFIAYILTRYIVIKSISHFFKRTSTDLDDILLEKGLFNRLSYLPPLMIIYSLNDIIPLFEYIERVVLGIIVIVIATSINAFVNASSDIYSKSRYAGRLNMKSYLQVFKLIVNLFAVIIFVAVLSGNSPLYLLSE